VAEWLRAPDVPVKVTVALPAAAAEATVRVTFCAVPGFNESVAGFAVTPEGSPVIVTATVPLKEFTAVARTLTFEPVAPATRVRDVGDTVSVKSGGGGGAETVTATVAEWLRAPDVPVKVTVALPAAAEGAAVRVTFCAVPGVNESVAGLAVTPEGSPVIATETLPLKEFAAVARTLTFEPAAPATRVSDVGDTVSEKSGGGGGVETVTVTVVEWLRSPDVPVKVTVALPAAAAEAAVRVTFCAVPGVNESVAGLAVTPVGSSVIATATIPAKPLAGTAFTLIICPWPPAAIATVAGVAVSEKSCGGPEAETKLDRPPQETRERQRNIPAASAIVGDFCANRRMPEAQAAFGAEEQAAWRESDSLFCNRRPHGSECLNRTIGATSPRAGKRLIEGEESSEGKDERLAAEDHGLHRLDHISI
jgi:hypothetical protein